MVETAVTLDAVSPPPPPPPQALTATVKKTIPKAWSFDLRPDIGSMECFLTMKCVTEFIIYKPGQYN